MQFDKYQHIARVIKGQSGEEIKQDSYKIHRTACNKLYYILYKYQFLFATLFKTAQYSTTSINV